MRYHYEKPEIYLSKYGKTYICDHPVYSSCTLFKIGDKGLAVIQQRFDPETKETKWSEIDPWLTDVLYLHPRFKEVFDSRGLEILYGRAVSYRHDQAAYVGSEDEASQTGEMGDGVRP